ncbi:nitrate reductase molybdenum cofactor assembly chaperone [Cupriavidus sp. UGS-1]|uniref:nitrate reductase molybdenum cofactor assembly chaperone n=1 Tax=Cupriavidus sp. UGS-1 TaxID=2899826 RepID=UPI001E4F43F8|nr:nitrate reductase molybdenum cofactor assembly chaperone [Cupriavidus sp. UGS-1]MCD9123959.1 nitrate reductase molybdenum cofactor assembly chaperone [Cupriavidus sp. UGS-1]
MLTDVFSRAAAPSPATFSLLSALLDYPEAALLDAVPQARRRVAEDRSLPRDSRADLERFLDYLAAREPLTLQENYVALFDRGRATSLHLFEHVHGESRDRGQAMVDLLQMYERHGLRLQAGHLPDYLPVFLEYLSRLPASDAVALLAETGEILQSIAAQLAQRRSHYALPLGALLRIIGQRPLALTLPEPSATDADDAARVPSAADYRELDAAYADEPVRFVGAGQPAAEPVRFYDKRPQR